MASCTYKIFKLSDGITKVAANPKVYSNKSKFKGSMLGLIDTAVIYQECCTIIFLDSSFFGSKKAKYSFLSYRGNTFISAYKFYNNGCFNLFIIKPNEERLTKEMIDPGRTGWRGVYYYDKNNRIKTDLITQISGTGTIGKLTEYLEFKADTLFVSENKANFKRVFLKRRLPKELLVYSGTW